MQSNNTHTHTQIRVRATCEIVNRGNLFGLERSAIFICELYIVIDSGMLAIFLIGILPNHFSRFWNKAK